MTHGVLKGLLLGLFRLLRCVGGLYTGGLDPVPKQVTARYLFGSYRTFFRFHRHGGEKRRPTGAPDDTSLGRG